MNIQRYWENIESYENEDGDEKLEREVKKTKMAMKSLKEKSFEQMPTSISRKTAGILHPRPPSQIQFQKHNNNIYVITTLVFSYQYFWDISIDKM